MTTKFSMINQTFDKKDFRRALGGFATGVTVVTTRDDNGRNWGFTANSFTSVSLDPPLVLACIAKSAYSYTVFTSAPAFAINILAEKQKNLAATFSQPVEDRFAGVDWRTEHSDCPILADVVSWFDCDMHEVVDGGDHAILIGRVSRFGYADTAPLGYCRGAYVPFGIPTELLRPRDSLRHLCVGAIIESDNHILLRRLMRQDSERQGWALPTSAAMGSAEDGSGLLGGLSHIGVETTLPFVFAVYDGEDTQNIYYRDDIMGETTALEDDNYRWFSFADIPWADVPDSAVRTMLRRYISERSGDAFGIYVGNEVSGEIHVPG